MKSQYFVRASALVSILAALSGLAACSGAVAQAAAPAAAASSPEIQALQARLDFEKQRNALQAELLASQKALIDAQKASVDSQAQLLTSQKSLFDAMFPQITGGKAGAISFDNATNIGPLAQPGATEALNALADDVCKSVGAVKSSFPDANKAAVILAIDSDLKLLAQARWINLQLAGLKEAYNAAPVSAPAGGVAPNAFPAGLALYGVSAALKEVASFTQLFRTDTTVYASTIKIDQDGVTAAVAGCLRKAGVAVFLPKTLLANSLAFPSNSGIQDSLKVLEQRRQLADAELNTLAGRTDDASKRRVARLTALNASMDNLITSLFATSEKSPEPLLVGVLAGEAMQIKMADDAKILQVALSNAAASGIKRTSLWRSDRLYSWATVTVNYALFDSSGGVVIAGSIQNSPEGRKIEVAP